MSSFQKTYQEKKEAFESGLLEIFSDIKEIPSALRAAIAYSLLDGGKRMRPLLLLETYRVFNGEPDGNVVRFAVAVECVHCYSLIHDDLPCMDNDDFRRGRATSHKVFGEATAVLAGDALLNLAYELIFDAMRDASDSDKEKYLKAALLFSKNAGARGLIAGQIHDIGAESEVSADMLKYIFCHKTGDLIVSACAAGAILGGASKEELLHILSYAEHFAFAYQIKDDILDFREKKSENTSFVKVYGLLRANQTLGDSTQKAQKELAALGNRDIGFLKKMTLKFASRKE